MKGGACMKRELIISNGKTTVIHNEKGLLIAAEKITFKEHK